MRRLRRDLYCRGWSKVRLVLRVADVEDEIEKSRGVLSVRFGRPSGGPDLGGEGLGRGRGHTCENAQGGA